MTRNENSAEAPPIEATAVYTPGTSATILPSSIWAGPEGATIESSGWYT